MDTNAYTNRADYRRWAEGQPNGRYERVDGQVVRMTPQRAAHALLKVAVWRALDDAIRAAGLAAKAYPDGMTVEIGEDTDYEPDSVVNVGARLNPDEVAVPNPVVVVEVLSPGTQSVDKGKKLADYFSLPSVAHYLIFSAQRRQVRHHRRVGNVIVATIATAGEIALDPPGIAIDIDAIYRDAES